eukprot:m.96424 g.96424  ORF g.96424 m.96424 type:complete len:447 (-) comp14792_c0_seq6:209-1549(-)
MSAISPDASLILSPPKARPTPNFQNASYVFKSEARSADSPRKRRSVSHYKTALEKMLPSGLSLGQSMNPKVHLVTQTGRNATVLVLKVTSELEKTIMQLLKPHPHCVPCKVYPFPADMSTQRHWLIAMPFFPETLRDHCMRSPEHQLDEDTIWSFLLDLTLALDHLALHGVVHKDFKDDNILCEPRTLPNGNTDTEEPYCCVLADFGVASATTAQSESMRLGGGDGDGVIMAPEAIQSPSHKSDMFSLGLTTAELKSSYRLPPGGSETYHRLRQGTFPEDFLPRESISPELHATLENLIAVDPADRPSARELLRTPHLRRRLERRVWRQLYQGYSMPSAFIQLVILVMLFVFATLQFLLGTTPDIRATAYSWWLQQRPSLSAHILNRYHLRPVETSHRSADESLLPTSPNLSGINLRRFSMDEPVESDDESQAGDAFISSPRRHFL